MQGWNSEFGSNKVRKKLKQGKEKRLLARKKDCWQGKKTAGKDFRESALTPVATKFDKKVRKCEGGKGLNSTKRAITSGTSGLTFWHSCQTSCKQDEL